MPRSKNSSVSSLAFAFVGIVLLIIVGLEVWKALQERDLQLKETSASVNNVAFALAQHANETLKEADIVLVGVLERLQHDGVGPATIERTHKILAIRAKGLTQLNGIFVYDENGNWIVTSQDKLETKFNNSDREYFRYHRSHEDTGPYIGLPIQSRSTGRWILTISRRVSKPDGSFGGVALATLDISYFKKFYENFYVGTSGAIVLGHMNGTMLLRRPLLADSIGKDMANASVYRDFVSKTFNGNALIKSAQDGVVRINSFRRLDDYPLFVAVAMSRAEVLADWRTDTLFRGGVVFLLMSGLIFIGRKLGAQIQRRESAEYQSRIARLEIEDLNRSLEQLAMQDGLTGLANRRHFDHMLAIELARSVRDQVPMSLLMLDVDHFKLYNDNYGHLRGDECLKKIAEALRASLQRPSDLAARYGGEEFAVILPNCGAEGALSVAERIRFEVHQLELEHRSNPKRVVTVSLGVSTFECPSKMTLPSDLIEAADGALYESKHKGRDQVTSFVSLPSNAVSCNA
ncbi:diguanylate cyclase [Herbaspirillum sp. meg3]|uniref:sensor domain-containing diguanylate cyclase n=1 Tax=Herbaspirillum sp. meg3 TaxID=2025949 RepID=UPI000B986031|nr:sensor domain-containing diguanylate cyclase [Herbaspirillum sp. meg3]ASU37157.1 diguanylate cyclase [Herbaspirillum sp. meg3]